MALINLYGFNLPLEWFVAGLLALLGLVGTIVLLAWKYYGSQNKLGEAENYVWVFEPSGLTRIIELKEEDSTHIKYDLEKKEYTALHHHPFTPVGTAERVHLLANGSSETVNPEALFKNRNLDDPTPLLQEKAHWEHEAHSGIGSAVDLFARHWPTFVLVGAVGLLVGVILDAKVLMLR